MKSSKKFCVTFEFFACVADKPVISLPVKVDFGEVSNLKEKYNELLREANRLKTKYTKFDFLLVWELYQTFNAEYFTFNRFKKIAEKYGYKKNTSRFKGKQS